MWDRHSSEVSNILLHPSYTYISFGLICFSEPKLNDFMCFSHIFFFANIALELGHTHTNFGGKSLMFGCSLCLSLVLSVAIESALHPFMWDRHSSEVSNILLHPSYTYISFGLICFSEPKLNDFMCFSHIFFFANIALELGHTHTILGAKSSIFGCWDCLSPVLSNARFLRCWSEGDLGLSFVDLKTVASDGLSW